MLHRGPTVDTIPDLGPRPRTPRARVRLRFDPPGLAPGCYVECGRCATLVGPEASPRLAWRRWRIEGHDTDEHRGQKVLRIEVPVERIVKKKVEVPVEKVVIQERRIYYCGECDRTFDERDEFEAHRRECTELLDQRVRSMLKQQIRAMGLQDQIGVK